MSAVTSQLEKVNNWGSFDVLAATGEAQVVEWRTGRIVKEFHGPTATADADTWAEELHWIHDLG